MSDEKKPLGLDVSELMPDLVRDVQATLKQRALESLGYSMSQAISEEAGRYLKEEVLPKVRVELMEHEAEIRAAFLAALRESVNLAAAAVVEQAKQKIAGYKGQEMIQDIVGKLFGRY